MSEKITGFVKVEYCKNGFEPLNKRHLSCKF